MKDMFIDPLKNLPEYKKLIGDIEVGLTPISMHGIIDENLGHMTYSINQHTNRQIVLVTYDEKKAKELYEDLKSFKEDVYYYSHKDPLFFKVDSFSLDIGNERMKILSRLNKEEDIIVVTYIDAIIEKIMSRELFREKSFEFNMETIVDLDDLTKRLVESGYKRESMVEGVGQFSIRGGIIDIFSPDNVNPYRIELFDDEVDSIRTFDIDSQRSIESLDSLEIIPTRDILICDSYREGIIDNLKKELEESLASKDLDGKLRDKLEDKFYGIVAELEDSHYMTNSDLIKPYMPRESLGTIFDYLMEDALVILDEPRRLEDRYEKQEEIFKLQTTDLFYTGEILKSHLELNYNYRELLSILRKKKLLIKTALIKTIPNFQPVSVNTFSSKPIQTFYQKMDMLKEDLDHYMYRGYKIIILVAGEKEARELKDGLMKEDIVTSFVEDRKTDIKSGQVIISLGSIHNGFEYSDIKFLMISEKELFGRGKDIRKPRKKKKKSSMKLSDLEIGDYVVHENHGIGQYLGVDQMTIQGVKKDYLTLKYKGNDKLYVPIDQMNLIQKYIGSEKGKPKVNKLSSKEWSKTKYRVKQAVEEMAEDLIELYAKREKLKGHQYPEDTLWQREFEGAFPYEATDAQDKSIEEIKKDMESPKPMDRLLCGDVGYGKTEVALRAVFKAVMDNKQVAFLVPTTILAQQHYNTMVDRFRDFPISIGMMSRFRTPKEQKQALEGMKKGTMDIIVGTHRILSKDMKFKDLGLLVIDEEQRFGVKHKEKIKQLKENVDVLTLTATPIPRTLHMSMVGIRDMSVLDEPPEERYPVQTYVVEYNEQMVREAILKEISRNGQVYFVYNRVYDIDEVALKLRDLIPEARIGVAHGQMGERELENEMLKFISHEYDILVCTTIIETGLDIPNVNTMIIYDADKMGLSQLYQLRGRVGRSNRIAYSYFTYEKDKVLTEVAEKRLGAIKDFTEFGSGFKIAMRDLQIRGAGNLLGTAQHGHMDAIGYDLYVKFLNESVRKLKGQKIEERLDTSVDLEIDGYIPDHYIVEEEQKIDIYKKIAAIESNEDYMELVDELIDRFGDIPRVVNNLMDISYIQYLSSVSGIREIYQKDREVVLEYASEDYIKPELVYDMSKKYGRSISFDLSGVPALKYRFKKDVLGELKELAESIYSYKRDLEKDL